MTKVFSVKSLNGNVVKRRLMLFALLPASFPAVCSLAANVSPTDVEGAYIWNVRDGDNYAKGSWELPENWLINGGSTAVELPEAGDRLWFKGPGTYAVDVADNHAVKAIFVGCPTSDSPKMTLDLGGKTLEVSENVRVGYSWVAPLLIVTNGTMNIGGKILQGFDSNYESAFGYLYVRGPQTSVNVGGVDWGMRGADGAKETFVVSDGAIFSSKGSFNALTKSIYRFTGSGTTITIGGALRSVKNDGTRVLIENGASVKVTGSDSTTANGNSGSLIVGGYRNDIVYTLDNASLTVENESPVVIGDNGTDQVRGGNALVVKNGATMIVTGAETWVGGAGAAATDMAKYSYDNRLEVLSDSTFTSDSAVIVGHKGHAINGWFRIDDALATVKNVVLGSGYDGCDTNNWIKIGKGHATKLVCTGSSGLAVNQRGGVEFVIDADGYAETPIQILSGEVSVATTGQYWKKEMNGAMPRLVVKDEGFAKKHGETTIALIECGVGCKDALMMLATNLTVSVEREDCRGFASVSEDGKRLLYTTPPRPGMMLFFH